MSVAVPPEALHEAARRSLDVYAGLVHKDDNGEPLLAYKHQRLWIQLAHRIEAGDLRRLLIIAPPGGAKSTWWSLTFVPWYLGRHPEENLLAITSSDSQAGKFGEVVARVLSESPEHQAIFPDPHCRPDKGRSWSADRGYYLQGTRGSSKDPAYQSVGFTSKIIGNRANGILLDDPLDEKDSRSDTVLADAKKYIDRTLRTRLHPTKGWLIAIMTSWNENDIAHFLANKEGWEVVHIPALGDPDIKPISPKAYFYPLEKGQSFWEKRFPAAMLEEIRRDPDEGGASFNAVYQGDPTALGGDVFKAASWFKPLPEGFDKPLEVKLPNGTVDNRTPRERLRIFAYMDPNFSVLETSDYTAIVVLGLDSVKNMYVLGVKRGHYSTKQEYVDAIVEMVSIHQPHLFGMELSAWKQKFCRDIWTAVMEQVLVGTVKPNVAQGDKESRARLPAGYAAQGKLFVDMDAPWAQDFMVECLGFPNAKNDDQVDALSGAAALAAEKASYVGAEASVTRQKYTMRSTAA